MRPSTKHSSRTVLCLALVASLAMTASGADSPLITAPQSAPATLNTNNELSSSGDVVPADLAFSLNAFPETDGSITLAWEFPPRYYLYRKSLTAQTSDGTTLQLELPKGEIVSDEFFGESEVYFERLLARIPAFALKAAPGSTLELQLGYQGCLQDTLCYPAQIKTATVQLPE
jgi:thiol:disulfide interchange protein